VPLIRRDEVCRNRHARPATVDTLPQGVSCMLIRLQCEQRQWRVLHPDRPEPIEFRDGARAYDFAETLARLHFVDTGQRAAVRVEASGAFVEAVSYG